MGYKKLLNKEQQKYLREIIPGRPGINVIVIMGWKFGIYLTKQQFKSYKVNHRLGISGFTGQFRKGHIPANKGKKFPGSNIGGKTKFQKGHRPVNYLPIGTELMKGDGYIWVKIGEPNKWKQKHILLWQRENGPIPKGKVITFLDGDHAHCSLDNLMLITRSENARMNQNHLYQKDKELTKIGIGIAKIYAAMGQRKGSGK